MSSAQTRDTTPHEASVSTGRRELAGVLCGRSRGQKTQCIEPQPQHTAVPACSHPGHLLCAAPRLLEKPFWSPGLLSGSGCRPEPQGGRGGGPGCTPERSHNRLTEASPPPASPQASPAPSSLVGPRGWACGPFFPSTEDHAPVLQANLFSPLLTNQFLSRTPLTLKAFPVIWEHLGLLSTSPGATR